MPPVPASLVLFSVAMCVLGGKGVGAGRVIRTRAGLHPSLRNQKTLSTAPATAIRSSRLRRALRYLGGAPSSANKPNRRRSLIPVSAAEGSYGSKSQPSLDVNDFMVKHAFAVVKRGSEEPFAEASVINAVDSINDEPSLARFDVLQSNSNPSQFILVQVFKDRSSPTVGSIETLRMTPRFPLKASNWMYPEDDDDDETELICRHLSIRVDENAEKEFLELTILNARNSIMSDGVARFDVLQHDDDPQQFMIVQAFKNEEAQKAHEGSEHNQRWLANLPELLAANIAAAEFSNIFPLELKRWEYQSKLS
eukprot:jgi/Bigna1/139412/aug1.50_g14120